MLVRIQLQVKLGAPKSCSGALHDYFVIVKGYPVTGKVIAEYLGAVDVCPAFVGADLPHPTIMVIYDKTNARELHHPTAVRKHTGGIKAALHLSIVLDNATSRQPSLGMSLPEGRIRAIRKGAVMGVGANTVRTQVVDKNNKVTHVHKNAVDNTVVRAGGLPPIAKAASKWSGQEILQRPPVVLNEEDQYDFTVEDGVDRDSDIAYADIYRHEDYEDGTQVYVASGYSNYDNPKVWLGEHVFGITDKDEQYDFVMNNADTIDQFLSREYGAEVDWTDDLEYRLKWEFEMSEPISVDEAFDRWDETKSLDYYNESDPGTFGVRNMWAAMGRDIEGVRKAKEATVEELRDLATDNYANDENTALLRGVAFDGRLNGDDDASVSAQRALVSNRATPEDAILEVATKNADESVQLLAVGSGKLSESSLASIRSSTGHESVRNAADEAINKNIVNGLS